MNLWCLLFKHDWTCDLDFPAFLRVYKCRRCGKKIVVR